MSPLRASGVARAFARCLLTARWPVDRWLRALNVRGARSRRPRDLPNLLSLACLNQLCPTAAARPRRRPWLHAPAAPLRMPLLPGSATHLPLAACVATSPAKHEMPDTPTPWQVLGCSCVHGPRSSAWRSKSRRLRAPPAPTSWTWRSSISWTSPSIVVRSSVCSLFQHVMPARPAGLHCMRRLRRARRLSRRELALCSPRVHLPCASPFPPPCPQRWVAADWRAGKPQRAARRAAPAADHSAQSDACGGLQRAERRLRWATQRAECGVPAPCGKLAAGAYGVHRAASGACAAGHTAERRLRRAIELSHVTRGEP